ncbi:MAG: hypothetical protein ACO3UU_03815 [Minisyncoccia bacterium]
MSRSAKKEVLELFVKWHIGKANKWDVYPRCYDLFKARKVTKKFIITVAQVICGINNHVVNDRLRYIKALDAQVVS